MLVHRTEYAPGLGDLASTLKARSAANKPNNAPSLVSTYGTNQSQKIAVASAQNKVLSLIGQANALSQYNKDLAAGNINPNFTPPPAPVDPATLAAARIQYAAAVKKSGTLADKSIIKQNTDVQSAVALSKLPSIRGSIAAMFGRPMVTVAQQPVTAVPVTTPTVISPAVQQAASALVAAQPTSTLSTTGGGGGGGDGSITPDTSTPDTTDATVPTGWAALSPSMQTGIIVGGLVVVGGIVYLIRKR